MGGWCGKEKGILKVLVLEFKANNSLLGGLHSETEVLGAGLRVKLKTEKTYILEAVTVSKGSC